GRVMDHLRRKTLKLDHVHTLVLDEADEMLDMGFIEDIETIITQMPEERQTLLFSATMPPEIKRLATRYMKQPQTIAVSREEVTAPL
ncbi:ATP-dependent helicase, partial [Acinetobacter baumannii]